MPRLVFDIETVGEDFDLLDKATKEALTWWIKKESNSGDEYKAALEDLKNGLGFSPLTGQIAAVGVFTIAATTSPYFLYSVISSYFKDKTRKMALARARKLQELKRRKLISFRELGNGNIRIELSHLGKSLIRLYNLEDMKIEKSKRWDGWWRMIIYDIPTRQKRASNAFREKLKELGLYPLQRSAWVYPYEFFPEIGFLATVFEISIDDCICYLKIKEIPHEEKLIKFFGIR